MTDLSHLLTAVDDSDWTQPVLDVTGVLARRLSARVALVHAESVDVPPYFTEEAVASMAKLLEDQRQAALDWLQRMAAGPLAGVSVEAHLIEAPPVEAILHEAQRLGSGLILLGTHGRSGLNRLLLGSVAERVVRQSPVPVLTVRRADSDGFEPRRLLCPVNFRDVSQTALDTACELAARLDAEVIAMHAVEPQTTTQRERLQALCDESRLCQVHPVERHGEAAEQILQAAAEEAADIIVLGAERRPLLDATTLGTTSVRVVRHATCPVLSVPHTA